MVEIVHVFRSSPTTLAPSGREALTRLLLQQAVARAAAAEVLLCAPQLARSNDRVIVTGTCPRSGRDRLQVARYEIL